MLAISLQIVSCFVVADLLSGLVHWLEDAYGNESFPVLGGLVTVRNNLHHRRPAYFTRFGWWHGSWLLHVLSGIAGLGLACAGAFTWHAAVVLVLTANANQIHKWAHRAPRRNGALVTSLQRVGLLQSQRHHAAHHSSTERTHYCVITPWLNPVLDRSGVWVGLERAIELVTGVRRRVPGGASLRG